MTLSRKFSNYRKAENAEFYGVSIPTSCSTGYPGDSTSRSFHSAGLSLNPSRFAGGIIRVGLAGLTMLMLSACSTTAPDRLGEPDFDSWVKSANVYVMDAPSQYADSQLASVDSDPDSEVDAELDSTSDPTLDPEMDTELNRVSERVEKLVEFAESSKGEASWVIRNWSTNSRKIGTLFDYFLTRGYLLNYRYGILGGDFIIPMGRDRYGLTYASTGLSRVFGDSENFISPWIINDDNFTFATNYGPAPFLNRQRADELKARILSGATADESVSLGVDLGVVMQMLAAREVARSTLNLRYGFDQQSEFNAVSLEDAIPGLSVESADEVHLFFSQASSLAAHPFGIYLLVADTLNVMNDVRSSEKSEYARTAAGNFFVSSVNEILARLGRPYDVDSAFRVNTLREVDERWKAVGKIGNDILVHLGQRGLDDLRADYVQYAKTILNHIETDS